MKYIKLTQNKNTVVDDDDYAWLSQWKWYYSTGYARRSEYNGPKCIHVYMHILINKTPSGFLTDHINRNKLDNRRSNLRSVTPCENIFNRGRLSRNTSGVVGVHWDRSKHAWAATICIDKQEKFLGRYKEFNHAVEARKSAEQEYLSRFGTLC